MVKESPIDRPRTFAKCQCGKFAHHLLILPSFRWGTVRTSQKWPRITLCSMKDRPVLTFNAGIFFIHSFYSFILNFFHAKYQYLKKACERNERKVFVLTFVLSTAYCRVILI